MPVGDGLRGTHEYLTVCWYAHACVTVLLLIEQRFGEALLDIVFLFAFTGVLRGAASNDGARPAYTPADVVLLAFYSNVKIMWARTYIHSRRTHTRARAHRYLEI
jgi:hypothetical protein